MACMRLSLLALLVAAPGAAVGEERVLHLRPEHARVAFVLDAGDHDVRGGFALQEPAAIAFDDETGRASGRVVLDATSAETGKARRDKKMHRKVLESDEYPEIVLDVTGLRGRLPDAGPGELTILGTVSIAGASHPVALTAAVERRGDALTATAPLTVPYVAWGMEDPSFLWLEVAEEVQVTVEIEGRLESVSPAP